MLRLCVVNIMRLSWWFLSKIPAASILSSLYYIALLKHVTVNLPRMYSWLSSAWSPHCMGSLLPSAGTSNPVKLTSTHNYGVSMKTFLPFAASWKSASLARLASKWVGFLCKSLVSHSQEFQARTMWSLWWCHLNSRPEWVVFCYYGCLNIDSDTRWVLINNWSSNLH